MKPLRVLFLAAACALFALLPRDAQAKMYFGDQQYIHFLQDVRLKGPKGETLFLGHMYRIKYFMAGLYLSNEGYVLGIKGDRNRFYRMPGAAQVAQFQRDGVLPKTFPPYRIGVIDYLIGYSLWILLAFFLGLGAISRPWRQVADATASHTARPSRLPGAAP